MEQSEFIIQTQRLCDLYGKNLNETQADYWYINLKPYDLQTYQRAVGEYARKNKYMPTIADILETIKNIKNRTAEEIKTEEKPQVKCDKCHGTGLIKYIKDGYEYLCTCNCPAGKWQKQQNPRLLTWGEVFPHVENTMVIPEATTAPDPAPTPLNYDLQQINF